MAVGFLDWIKTWRSPNGNGASLPSAPPAEQKGIRFEPGFIPADDQGRTIDLQDDVLPYRQITTRNAYVASAYIYAAMHWRAWKYAEAPLFVARETDEGEEWLPDHEVQDLLDNPAVDYDQGELLRLTRMYRDLTGMCIWHKARSRTGGIARLTPYSGEEFTIQRDLTGERIYGRFDVTNVTGEPLQLAPDEVVLFRETNPYNWLTGVAPVKVALEAVGLSRKMIKAITKVAGNAKFRSAMMTTSKEWDPPDDVWEQWRQDLKRAMREHNEGDPFVAHGAERIYPVGLSMVDLAPAEVLDRIEAIISSVMGVPAVVLQYLVGLKNSPWSQMAEARRMAVEDVIEPMWRADRETLTRQLLHAPVDAGGRPLDEDPATLIGFDSAQVKGLERDRKTDSDISTQNREIMTRNERRIMVGLEPLPDDDERGDEIVGGGAQGSGISVAGDTNAGLGLRTAPRRSERKQGDDTLELPRSFIGQVQRTLISLVHDDWLLAVGKLLEDDKTFVDRLITETLEEKQATPESARRLQEAIEKSQEFEDAWLETVMPVIRTTGTAAVENVASRVGLSFDVLQPGLEAYIEQHAAELVTEVTSTTKDSVKRALAKGMEAGEGIPELAARIEEAGAFAPSRAELIARTEATAVTNQSGRSSLASWSKESGRRVEKSWLSAQDDRVRPAHQALDNGEYYPIDHDYPGEGPEPSSPNCRCTLLYRTVEE